jgi:hypothetical protein
MEANETELVHRVTKTLTVHDVYATSGLTTEHAI